MAKKRLDNALVDLGLVASRSQAESYIKLGKVKVDGNIITKPGTQVSEMTKIKLDVKEQYVSRAALKLASIAKDFNLDFKDKLVLDVGSSTGGFTDYALRHGALMVYAVEKGTDQLHPSLRANSKIKLFEKTDIRDFSPAKTPDIVLIDVSFIPLRQILPYVSRISGRDTEIVAMVKPQFEAEASDIKHKGVIKNDKMRRQVLKDFEVWATSHFIIKNKSDSQIAGAKGNLERFYLLKKA